MTEGLQIADTQAVVTEARRLMGAGNLEAAGELLERMVTACPECAAAWMELGRLALLLPDLVGALDFYGEAVRLQPNDVNALSGLGDVQRRAGYLTEAQASLQSALAMAPGNLLVACKLANCHVDCGDLFKAKELLSATLLRFPQVPELYLLRGLTLRQMGENSTAEADLRICIGLQPDMAVAQATLADICREKGALDEASALLQSAARLAPDDIAVLRAQGDLCLAQRDWREAVRFLDQVVAREPEDLVVLLNRAVALVEMGDALGAIDALELCLSQGASEQWVYEMLGVVFAHRGQWEAALESLEKAVEQHPENPNAWNVLIVAYNKLGLLDKSERAAKRALEIEPRHFSALTNLAGLYIDQGRHDEGVACFNKALEIDPNNAVAYAGIMFGMLFSSKVGCDDLLRMGRRYDANICQRLRKDYAFDDRDRNPERKLRVGWVSSDLRAHPVGAFIAPMLPHFDREHFESYVYDNWPTSDAVTEMIRPWCSVWRSVRGLGDNALAECIRADEIDILVDLNGHTAGHRLGVFARKPAPVQVEWLGYPGSSGISAIDYVLVPNDPYLLSHQWSVEQPWPLPTCYGIRGNMPDVAVREGMPFDENGYITFACMNRFSKVSAAALDLWGEILKRAEGARLMLIGRGGKDEQTVADLHARFARHGVAAERLIILESQPVNQYFDTYNRADLCLDPFPFNGGTTGFDSIWMGVPFVTLRGDALHSRAGSNILRYVGLDALIAENEAEYVDKALAMVRDVERLRDYRSGLRERMMASPLMDGEAFANGIEDAFRSMWKKWCSNEG